MKNIDRVLGRLAERNVRMAILTAVCHWAPAFLNAVLVASIWLRLRPRALGWFERQLLQSLALTAGASGFAWAGANRPEFDAATLDVTGMSWDEAKTILSGLFADEATIDESEVVIEAPPAPAPTQEATVRVAVSQDEQGKYVVSESNLAPGLHFSCEHLPVTTWVADVPLTFAEDLWKRPTRLRILPYMPEAAHSCEATDEEACFLQRACADAPIPYIPTSMN